MSTRPCRVLLIEDNPGDARLIKELLREDPAERFHVVWAQRLSEVEACLAAEPADVVVLDLTLPDSQGMATVDAVQRAADAPPVVVLTGVDDRRLAYEALGLGVQDYLVKGSIDGGTLVRSLRYAIERGLLERRMRELARRLNGLRAVNHLIIRSEEPQVLISEACRAIVEEAGFAGAWIALWRRGGGRVRLAASYGALGKLAPQAGEHLDAARLRSLRRMLEAGVRVSVDDTAYPASQPEHCRSARQEGLASFQVFPLRLDGEDRGAMSVYGATPKTFPSETLHVLEEVAGDISFALRGIERERERRETLAALEESRERYRAFFEEDLTADFMATVDGRLIDCNPAFLEMFGFRSREDAFATHMADLYPSPERRQAYLEELSKVRRLTYHEKELRRLDGRPIQVIENAVGLYDEQGRLAQVKGYLFDITAQRDAETQLLRTQKLEALGRFASGIAHDFNNLLQAMYSAVDLRSLEGSSGGFQGEAACREMKGFLTRGIALTRQLLLFAHKGVMRAEPLDARVVVREVDGLLRRLMPANVRLVTDLPPEPVAVNADRGQLEQVLMNLAVNAKDAMPGGGTLRMKLQGPASGRCVLEVSDTGNGMSEAVASQAFEPFFTTKPVGKGTGLGLSVVHGIVDQHGGSVELFSRPGEGTRLVISLPCISPERLPSTAEPEGMGGELGVRQGRGERVLLVEDEDDIRRLVGEILTALGYQVEIAECAEAAIEAVKRGAPFDVILSDITLPGRSGVALAGVVRERWPDTAVILMSGYPPDEVLPPGGSQLDVEFLQKPVNVQELAEAIGRALTT